MNFNLKLMQVWKRFPGITAAVLLTSILNSLIEGVSVLLLLPFLETINDSSSFALPSWITFLLPSHLTSNADLLPWLAGGMALAVILKASMYYTSSLFSAQFRVQVLRWIRVEILEYYRNLPLAEFNLQNPGTLMNTFLSQSECFLAALDGLLSLFQSTFFTLIYFGILLLTSTSGILPLNSSKIFIPSLFLIVAAYGLNRLISNRIKHHGSHLNQLQNSLANFALDEFENMPVTKAFNLASKRRELHDIKSSQFGREFFRMNQWLYVGHPFIQILVAVFFFIAVLLVGSRSSDSISHLMPLLISSMVILIRLQNWVSGIHTSLNHIAEFKPAAESILKLIKFSQGGKRADSQGTSISSASESIPLSHPGSPRVISVQKATFGYEGNRLIIRDIELHVDKGEMVALVGPSGCGKTTVAHLAAGLYSPMDGQVSLYGQPLNQIPDIIRSQAIGFAFEKSYIFDETVIWNIHLGRDIPEEKIYEIARATGILDFVHTLPNGFETHIGHQGITLSNGQRQRIALARALVNDPVLLILDEATSALDPVTEQAIFHYLDSFKKKAAILVISHRLHSVESADSILVMEGGNILARGSHHELLKSSILYRKLRSLESQI